MVSKKSGNLRADYGVASLKNELQIYVMKKKNVRKGLMHHEGTPCKTLWENLI